MIERDFRQCAKAMGVDARFAALVADCDRALAEHPQGKDRRWFWRIEDQRRRLHDPDLRMIVAMTTTLAEETPEVAPLVAKALSALVVRHAEFAPFHARLARIQTSPR